MLDVHPPHTPTHTWKDFLLHIATIVVGLLIAIGLEQSVEAIHHRHQVTQTREALRAERRLNHMALFGQTQEFYRFVPILQTNLSIFQYLRKHPGAPPQQWPGQLDWYAINTFYPDSAWKTAQQNNVLELMPDAEVRSYASLYQRLGRLAEATAIQDESVHAAAAFSIQDPDPSHLSPAQLDRQIDLTTQALLQYALAARGMRNLDRNFSDFPPTTTMADEASIWHTSHTPAYLKGFADIQERAKRFEDAHPIPSRPPLEKQ